MSNLHIKVPIPLDDSGMLGRECPNCKKYFKIKPGTGIVTDYCICPYCEHKNDSNEFITKEQLEFAQSVAVKEFSKDIFKVTDKVFKELARKTRNSFIQIKVSTRQSYIPIRYYKEKELETDVICDNCGCNFSIYGVFASCPDCSRLTTMSIFRKSIENIKKKLNMLDNYSSEKDEVYDVLLADIVRSGVAAFDGLGKRLRKEFRTIFPDKPKNLFQNIQLLDKHLIKNSNFSLKSLIGDESYNKVYFLFQVRHLWEHNFGEVDIEFVNKTGYDVKQIGKQVKISFEDAKDFVNIIEELGNKLRDNLKVL